MEIGKQLYEGKAKKVFATDDPKVVLVDYKDDATAFNGLKKGQIAGKGVINNRMSNMMFRMLEKKGIETHYIEEVDDRRTLVKKVEIVPLEVIVRNVAAGSFSKRYGVPEGTPLKFWDHATGEKLDKDRFRRDMGGVEDAYKEMMRRITEGA